LHSSSPPVVAVVAPFPPPPAGMTLQAEMLAALLARDGARVIPVNTNPYGRRHPRWRRLLYFAGELRKLRGCDLAAIFAGSWSSFFAFSALPLVWARLVGVPTVLMYKGGLARPFFKKWGWLVRPFARLARAIVVPGRFLQGVFAAYGMRAEVVPDIIDLERLPARPAGAGDPLILFNPRRHVLVCGVDVLVRAFERVAAAFPTAELHLCGDGPGRRELEQIAASYAGGDRVIFHGFVPPEDLKPFYARAALMVNANRDDNHPNSVLEAMAAGLPVVATAVGGVPFLIEDGVSGFLCAAEDPAALADRIVFALGHPDEAGAAAARAREDVRHFLWPYGRDGHLAVLLKLARVTPPTA
jgi:glycosyltransferase involved in cell wall biosynthesis